MSLASKQVYSSTSSHNIIVSALHSLHHLRNAATAIGQDFVRTHAGCGLSMSNCPDTCDSLHVINLASDVVSIAAVLLARY